MWPEFTDHGFQPWLHSIAAPRLTKIMYHASIYSTDGPVATIKLNRPEKLNAFGGSMREELLEALEVAATDDSVRVLVVTGEGRGFSAGGDIDHLKQLRENA